MNVEFFHSKKGLAKDGDSLGSLVFIGQQQPAAGAHLLVQGHVKADAEPTMIQQGEFKLMNAPEPDIASSIRVRMAYICPSGEAGTPVERSS